MVKAINHRKRRRSIFKLSRGGYRVAKMAAWRIGIEDG